MHYTHLIHYLTDIDLLDGLGNSYIRLSNGFLEGIQVADNDVNLFDVLLSQVLFVTLNVAGKDTYYFWCVCVNVKLDMHACTSAFLPPWTAGCKVLTRPPSISGALVISDTSLRNE